MNSCNRAVVLVFMLSGMLVGCDSDLATTSPDAGSAPVAARAARPLIGAPDTAEAQGAIATDASSSWCCTWGGADLAVAVGDTIRRVTVPTTSAPGDSVLLGLAVSNNGVTTFLAPNQVAVGTVVTNIIPTSPYVVRQGDTAQIIALAFSGGSTAIPAVHPTTIGPVSLAALQTLSIHGAAFSAGSFATASASGLAFFSPGGGTAVAPIVLPVGTEILGARVFVHDSSTAPTHLTASLVSVSRSIATSTIASSARSIGNGSDQTLTVSPPATTIVNGTGYALQVASDASDFGNIYNAEVDYQ